jgi:aspartate kinase
MKVFKFGGASVKDVNAVKNVAYILSLFKKEKLVVVVSAMGKTTNKLEEVVDALKENNKRTFNGLITELKEFHYNILGELFSEKHFSVFNAVDDIFEKLEKKIDQDFSDNYSFEYDQIVSLGEVLSSIIVSAFLNENGFNVKWTDARKLIRTDNTYQEGNVDWKKTEELVSLAISTDLKTFDILLTQGFIGHTPEGFTTTLGREGSDYTAGIFAYCANAENVTIWKDVPGMLNADPKYFDETIKLDEISFKEAIELAYYGATVIHPKTIKPLQNKEIPLLVKSFIEPQKDGTIIQSSTKNDALIPSYIFKVNQILISLTPKDFSFIVEENLSEIFRLLAVANAKINVMQNSAVSFHLLLDEKKTDLPKLLKIFGEKYNLKYDQGLEVVTIRHYNDDTIEKVTENKDILLQQKTRQTARLVMRNID